MGNDKTAVKIHVHGEPMEIERGTRLGELAAKYPHGLKNPILVAKVNNELQELFKGIEEDSVIEFLDLTSPNGFRVYQRSVAFLMIYAAKEILGKKVRVIIEHSINKNYYCEIAEDGIVLTKEILEKIEKKMRETVDGDVKIDKLSVPIEEGIRIAAEFGLYDKVQSLKYRRTSYVNFYRIDWFCDYFYGQMAPSTGVLKKFRLVKDGKGFLIVFPSQENPEKFTEVKKLKKISSVFTESNQWARIMKTDTVGALNDIICAGRRGEIIRINEALHEKRIANIADMIMAQNKQVVLIAGPSSSGKTTFAQRLCIQLRVNGLRPNTISLDDYYVDRDKTPKDEFGEFDFESLYAIDVAQFNTDLKKLINGEKVHVPSFNFIVGKREYKNRHLQLQDGDVLVIEGIHGLNEELTFNVKREKKFKIFISALTQLNLDDHNRIPTTDTRIIRRMVRDNQFRSFDPKKTISMWPSVIRGESKYIFPFQEDADAVFNSALAYELCVLKQYAEPLLFGIPRSEPEFMEAKRLVKFLDCFIGIPSEEVPNNSILREFIGGSCFRT